MQEELNLHPLFLENNVRGLVFDLDGTIIDSAADILHGMRLTFEQIGLGNLPDDYFPDNLYGTGEGIMRSIIDDMGWPVPADLAALRAPYVKHYATLNHERTRLYSGVVDVLKACREAGLSMGICTNKVHASAMTALQKFSIADLFDYVTGSDTWAQAKPSPVPLLETINMLELKPEQCLYFGDTSVDALCAHSADVRFVLHRSGYGDHALKNTTEHFAFHHWDELRAENASTNLVA